MGTGWWVLLLIVLILSIPYWLPIVAQPFQAAAQRRHDRAVKETYRGRDDSDTTESS